MAWSLFLEKQTRKLKKQAANELHFILSINHEIDEILNDRLIRLVGLIDEVDLLQIQIGKNRAVLQRVNFVEMDVLYVKGVQPVEHLHIGGDWS